MSAKPKMRFNADLFRIAHTCASTEGTRYYLCGVYVEPCKDGGCVLTTTDGHRLFTLRDPDGCASRAAIITLSKSAMKLCKPDKQKRIVEVTALDSKFDHAGRRAIATISTVDENGKELPVCTDHGVEIDGTYPDWRRVIPVGEMKAKGVSPPLRGDYLAHFAEIGKDLKRAYDEAGYRKYPHAVMQIQYGTPENPARIVWDGVPHALGLLMPNRGTFLSEPPGWACNA